jgi:hypothetical protein
VSSPLCFCTIVAVRYVNTYSRTQLYIYFLNIQEFTTTTCFGPICWSSSGCGWTFSLDYTSICVVVLGRNGAGSRSHYVRGDHGPGCIWFDMFSYPIRRENDIQPDTPGTMVPRDMRSRTSPITSQNHYTHASIV